MNRRASFRTLTLLSSTAVLGLTFVSPVQAQTDAVVVVHQGVVTRQDVKSQTGSETDTVVEPDVAVSPVNKNIAVAAAHDSRYPDGGAVGISVAWTADGGRSWKHRS